MSRLQSFLPLHVSVYDTDDFNPALYHPIIDDVFLEMCDRKEPYALKPSPFGLVQGAHGGHRGEGCKGLLYGFIDLVCCHPVVLSDKDPQVYEIAFRRRGYQDGGNYLRVVL